MNRYDDPDWTAYRQRGRLSHRYDAYILNADDGHGNDITTGDTPETRQPLKTYDEWLNS